MKKINLYDSIRGIEYIVPNLERVVVGRSRKCNVSINKHFDTTRVSREHCILQRFPDGESYVFDNNSKYGTYLNDRKLRIGRKNQDGTQLKDVWLIRPGDKLTLGDYVLEVIEAHEDDFERGE